MLHGKIKPFCQRTRSRHQTDQHGAGAQGGQVALFGITDIALRCSGTLKITLSQPDQVNAAPIRAPLPFNHDCFCFAPISSDLSESRLRDKTGDNESASPSPPQSSSERRRSTGSSIFKDPLYVGGYWRRERRGGDARGRGQQGSGPPLIHRLEATAGPPLGPE